jgi:hypothetical protein
MGLGINPSVYSEYAEKLHSIEKELRARPITWELREQIIQELDEVHQGISQLEMTAARVNQFAQSYIKQLRSQAIFLYGEVDDFFYKHEIDVIHDETQLLSQTLECKDRLRVAWVTDSLKAHINQLLESYSPLLKERRVLVLAKLVLEQSEALLNGQVPEEISLDEWAFLEAEEILEELAEYLGHNDRRGIRGLWSGLTPAQRRLLLAYLNPQDIVGLLHDVEGSTNDGPFLSA